MTEAIVAKNESEKKREFDEKFSRKTVGEPFSTERELVEEGKPREGTNLDLGEERSAEQLEELEKAREQGSNES